MFRCYGCAKEFAFRDLDDFSKAKKPRQVYEVIMNNVSSFFRDLHGRFFAEILTQDEDGGQHSELLDVDSLEFRYWAIDLFRSTQGDIVGKDSIKTALEAVKGEVYTSRKFRETHLRAWYDESQQALFYDLTDEKWQVISITQNGWSVEPGIGKNFVRYSHMSRQAAPLKAYNDGGLDEFIRLFKIKDGSSRHLFKVYLATLFLPDFPHPLLVVHGDHGSAKSSFMRAIKSIVDPSTVPLLKLSRDEKNVMLAFMQNYLVFFDNISNITKEQSDDLCRAVTGEGQLYRKLFEDEVTKTYSYIRNIGANGINNPAVSPDLLDRVLSIELERITPQERLTESFVRTRIEQLKPSILGWIFDVLSKALSTIGSLKLTRSHRLGDFARWGEAISRAMGYAPDTFLEVLDANAQLQVQTAIESNPVASLLVRFINEPGNLSTNFTMEELLVKLKNYAIAKGSDVMLPKSANSLSRRINEIKATLQEYGYRIERSRPDRNTKLVSFTKLGTLDAAGLGVISQVDSGKETGPPESNIIES